VEPDDVNNLGIELRRPASLQPDVRVPVDVFVLQADQDLSKATLAHLRTELASDGVPVPLRFDGKTVRLGRE
jgi:hypothetical protein